MRSYRVRVHHPEEATLEALTNRAWVPLATFLGASSGENARRALARFRAAQAVS